MCEVTAAGMKALERAAFEAGQSYLDMMERAGRASAREALDLAPGARRCVVVCGKGNNGGDGFVAARALWEKGLEVALVLAEGDAVTPDAAENQRRAAALGIPCLPLAADTAAALLDGADVVLDALYGTGFHGALRPAGALASRLMNGCPAPVLALDVPSGVACDTGEAAPGAVRAARTVTFHAAKPCHRLCPAHCGAVRVAPIFTSL